MSSTVSNYKPFIIQKIGDGETAYDSFEQWKMSVKSFPFKFLPEAKDPAANDWYDEDGDDEVVGTLKFKAYEIDVDFLMGEDNVTSGGTTTTSDAVIRTNLRAFFNYVKSGQFKIYDTYTGIGRQNVRYVKFKEDSFVRRSDHALLAFTVTFKVNDPVTDMTYNGTNIVEVE